MLGLGVSELIIGCARPRRCQVSRNLFSVQNIDRYGGLSRFNCSARVVPTFENHRALLLSTLPFVARQNGYVCTQYSRVAILRIISLTVMAEEAGIDGEAATIRKLSASVRCFDWFP